MADEPATTAATEVVDTTTETQAVTGPSGGNGEDRIERFRAEIGELGLGGEVAARERALLRVGVALMALGGLWVVVSYFVSHSTNNPLQQRDMVVSAVFGLTLAVVGCALYLRYSFGRFLRFWLARSAFEQRQQADALTEALHGRGARPVVRTRPLAAKDPKDPKDPRG